MQNRSPKSPFATSASASASASSPLPRHRRRAAISRLLKNPDFKEWMFAALFELCAFCDDTSNPGEFNSGKRAAGAFLRRTLLEAEEAPQFFADLDRRYYDGVRRGIIDASKRNGHEEGSRQ